MTTLVQAVAYQFSLEILQELIAENANFYERHEGFTALGWAIKNKNLNLVKFLIKNGADVYAKVFEEQNACDLVKNFLDFPNNSITEIDKDLDHDLKCIFYYLDLYTRFLKKDNENNLVCNKIENSAYLLKAAIFCEEEEWVKKIILQNFCG